MRTGAALLSAWMSLAIASTARAQGSPRDGAAHNDPTGAHAHYERGRTFYLQGHFLEAAREFRAAYEATLEPAFLYNAAMALYDGGDLVAAREAFRSYLREQPNTPNRAVIEQRVATIDRRLAVTSSSSPRVAERIEHPAIPPATIETSRAPLAWAGLAIGVAGLVSVGIGTGLYVMVDARYQRCLPNLCDASDEPRGLDAASVALLWGGGALALAGAALFLFVPPLRTHAAPTAFGIDPRGGAFVTFRF